MWETPPPDTAANAVGNGQEVLTPAAIENVLADFRSWLQQMSGAALPVQPEEEQTPPMDLHTLLGQFVALRHDVNLQTKAARSQQELTGQALEALRQAQATAQQGNQQAQDDALRPFLKTLLDVHDAFSLAEREIRRTQETILPHLDELAFASEIAATLLTEEPETEPQPKATWWQRWFGHGRSEKDSGVSHPQQVMTEKLQVQQRLDEQQEKIGRLIEHLDQLLDSIITGYSMSLQRLERGLERSGLEPLACVGQPFDPELMEVVAAAADTGRSPGEVIEEVRRGYRWHGRVFRYAQVSVAKS